MNTAQLNGMRLVAEVAAEEAYLNCVGVSRAVKEAVREEFGRCPEEVILHALAHLRGWVAK
jgi:hypothetical protein